MKRWFVMCVFFCVPFGLFSQDWEVGIMAGPAGYEGDVIWYPVELEDLRPGLGGFARYNFSEFFTLKGNVNFGYIAGDDANSESSWQRKRNWSFRTRIIEAGIQIEWNMFGFSTTGKGNKISTYGFVGLSFFNFKPEAKNNGEWVELQPLGTEGQGSAEYSDREKYNLNQISIPFGGGLKYALNKQWSVGIEAGLRKTFTDYLDDVSKTYVERDVISNRAEEVVYGSAGNSFNAGDIRGSPSAKDWYAFTGLTLSYTFVSKGCYNF